MRAVLAVLTLLPLLAPSLPAQHRVSPHARYERIWCVVPIVGSGTAEDPRRPMFAPWPPAGANEPAPSGIIAWQWLEADDHKSALVEFVALDRSAFAAIRNTQGSGVRIFEREKQTWAEVRAALKEARKDLKDDWMGMRVN